MKYLLSFILLLFLIGCTDKHKIAPNNFIEKRDLNATKVHGNQAYVNDTQEGLFILEDGRIYIKTDGRSVLDLIDELGFKKRVNYTVLAQMTNDRIRIANRDDLLANKPWNEVRGKTYASYDDFLTDLVMFMNYATQNRYNYSIVVSSSGLIIDADLKSKNSFAKMYLYNTSAKTIKENINEFYSSGSKPSYSIVTLPAQNALIIRADSETINEINGIIISADSNSPQVLIEAQVFEFDDSINRLIGTSLEQISQGSDYKRTIKTAFSEGVSDALPNFFNEMTNTEKKNYLLYSIAMQDRDGGVSVTAEPRIVLKPGKTAELRMQTKKYVTVSGVNTSKLENIDVGIVLKIEPVILSEDTILLNLELEQSDFIPTNENDIVQSINKNTVTTSVVAYDGELISIGGIYLQKQSNFNSGIPYMKDIPGVGFLFGSQNSSSSRIMVEFMIKPSIKKIEDKLNKIKRKNYEMQKNKSVMEARDVF